MCHSKRATHRKSAVLRAAGSWQWWWLHSKSQTQLQELEQIQPHMAQKECCGVKWGARVLRVSLVSREEVWASAGVQGAWVGGCGCEAD